MHGDDNSEKPQVEEVASGGLVESNEKSATELEPLDARNAEMSSSATGTSKPVVRSNDEGWEQQPFGSPKVKARAIARDTARRFETGESLQAELQLAIERSRHIGDKEEIVFQKPPELLETKILVEPGTTLTMARRLVASHEKTAALNFASAKNPGGGFMNGAIAQEECICRASGLYWCLMAFDKMPNHYYEVNRKLKGPNRALYSNCMIYSPGVPVIRNDTIDGTLLEEIYKIDVITAPAPNAGVFSKHTGLPEDHPQVVSALKTRIYRVLALAASEKCDALVLGAFGCGVFRNDPTIVANTFKELLHTKFKGIFKTVGFAILTQTGANFKSFKSAFSS